MPEEPVVNAFLITSDLSSLLPPPLTPAWGLWSPLALVLWAR